MQPLSAYASGPSGSGQANPRIYQLDRVGNLFRGHHRASTRRAFHVLPFNGLDMDCQDNLQRKKSFQAVGAEDSHDIGK
jgi:hypothetical protein